MKRSLPVVAQQLKTKSLFLKQNQAIGVSKSPNIAGVDYSDANKWPIASLLLRYFPGKITEERD